MIPVAKLHAALSGDILSSFVTDAEGLVRLSPYGLKRNYPSGRPTFRPGRSCASASAPEPARPGTGCDASRTSAGCRFPFTAPTSRIRAGAPRWAPIGAAFLRRHAERTRSTSPPLSWRRRRPRRWFRAARRRDGARDPAGDVRPLPQRHDRRAPAARPLQRRGDRSDRPRHRDRDSPAAVIAPSSPELMPPLRVGELPRWAIARIDTLPARSLLRPGRLRLTSRARYNLEVVGEAGVDGVERLLRIGLSRRPPGGLVPLEIA